MVSSSVRTMETHTGAAGASSRALLTVLAVVGVLVLGACGTGASGSAGPAADASAAATGEDSQAASGAPGDPARRPVETSVPKSGHRAALADVDPARFVGNGVHVFDFDTDGAAGYCVFDADEVTCSGTPAPSVPDTTNGPFSGRPNAIRAMRNGVWFTIEEGGPPAPVRLRTGQRVRFGAVHCAKPSDAVLECATGGAAFEIRGAGREIVVTKGDTTGGPHGENYAASNGEPAADGTMCGATGGVLVTVESGHLSCTEAESLILEYRRRAPEEGTGSGAYVFMGDWTCSTIPRGIAVESGVYEACNRKDGKARLTTPYAGR